MINRILNYKEISIQITTSILLLLYCVSVPIKSWANSDTKHTGISHSSEDIPYSSTYKLNFTIPSNMYTDRVSQARLKSYAIIVDRYTNMNTSSKIITIVYGKKYNNFDMLSYIKTAAHLVIEKCNTCEIVHWRPTNNFLHKVGSYESYDNDAHFSPSRAIFIEAGDGYYVVSIYAKHQDNLNHVDLLQFIASLQLVELK